LAEFAVDTAAAPAGSPSKKQKKKHKHAAAAAQPAGNADSAAALKQAPDLSQQLAKLPSAALAHLARACERLANADRATCTVAEWESIQQDAAEAAYTAGQLAGSAYSPTAPKQAPNPKQQLAPAEIAQLRQVFDRRAKADLAVRTAAEWEDTEQEEPEALRAQLEAELAAEAAALKQADLKQADLNQQQQTLAERLEALEADKRQLDADLAVHAAEDKKRLKQAAASKQVALKGPAAAMHARLKQHLQQKQQLLQQQQQQEQQQQQKQQQQKPQAVEEDIEAILAAIGDDTAAAAPAAKPSQEEEGDSSTEGGQEAGEAAATAPAGAAAGSSQHLWLRQWHSRWPPELVNRQGQGWTHTRWAACSTCACCSCC
jgi:hypothetical protein